MNEETTDNPVAEAGALAGILLASLVVSRVERFWASPGYASTLLLLIGCLAYAGWRKPDLRILRRRVDGLALMLAAVLAVGVWIAARILSIPQSGFGPTALEGMHLLLFVPFSEELFFRGCLLDHLRRQFAPGKAVAISAGLFALLHLGTPAVWPMLGLGLLAGAVAVRTRTLASAIQLHVAWNGLTQIVRMDDPMRGSWWIALCGILFVFSLLKSPETAHAD